MRGARFDRFGLGAHQHQRPRGERPVEREPEDDGAAERVPDEDRPVELERVDDRAEVGGPALQRELPLLELARARAAAEAHAHELIPGAERVAETVPERRLEAEPVDEDQRQALARHLDVELGAVDEQLLLNHSPPSNLCPDLPHRVVGDARRGSPAPTVRTPPRAEA